MTAFPNSELPQLPALATLPRKVRAIAVDSAVAENRRNTLPGDAEKRATPRLSIAELNASSLDDIRDKWARTRVDDRGPLTRFLDLLDLPRNTIANILAPGVAARKRASGETGALGMGTVRTADILDDIGVDNRVVRGVAGFVGDVALDPLTYIGPAGWGAKLTGTARVAKGLGATVQITKRGLKTARAAIENPVSAAGDIGEWLRLSGATTREAAQAAMGGNLRAKGVGAKAWRFLGDDISQGGSRLIDDAMTVLPEDPTEWAKLGYTANDVQRIKAAKRFVTAHNRAAQPGVRIGRNATGRIGIEVGSGPGSIKAGTQWAHIPFTDYALSGPAISSGARLGLRNERVVQNLYANAKDMQAIDQIQSGIKPIIDNIEEINRRAESHMDDIKATEAARVRAQEAMAAGDPAAAAEFARLDSVLKATEDGSGGSLVDLAAQANSEAKSAIDELNLIIARSRQTGDLSEAAQLYLAQHIIPGLRAKAAETAARFKVANAEAAYDKSVFQTGFKTEGQKQPGMTEYVDKQVANSVAEQKRAHDAAEAAKADAHPEVDFTKAEGGDEIGVGQLGTSGRAARGKSEADFLAEDPADKLGGVWTGGTNPHKVVRTSDPLNFTPELAAAEAKVYANATREDVDRRFLLGLANKVQSGKRAGMNPAKLNVGDSWTIGEYTATVHHVDDSNVILKLTKPDTVTADGIAIPQDPRYYALDKNRTLPADPNSFARAGGQVEPRPTPVPFDTETAKSVTAAKEWTEYRAKIQNAVYRNISDMSEGGIEARAAYADTLHQLAKAHEELAAATGAPLVQAMTSDDLIRRDIAALAVGANPEEIGGNPLASMAAVAEAIEKKTGNKHARETLDTLAGSVGKKFGNKSPSTAHDISRAINSANDMKSELVNQITTGIMADAQRLADLHDAKPSDVTTLMSVVAHATSGDIPIRPGDPIFEQLQYLAGKGYFKQGKGMTQSLYADTKALADKWKGALDELAQLEIDAGRLSGKMAEEYGFSNVMTPEAQQLIREQKANQLIGKGAANAKRVSAEEYFTKRRGTIEHTVKIGDKDVTFTEGDRIYSDWTDQDIAEFAAQDPGNISAAQNIRNRRDAIKVYDAMPPGTQPPGRSMSPVEINMRAERGEYNALTGGLRIPIMVQDAAVSAGYRFWAAERSKLMQQAMEFVKPYALDLNSDTLQRVVNTPDGNQVAHFKNGIQGRLYKTPTGDQRIRIGDVVYRAPKLDADAPHLWNPGELLGNDPNSYLPDKLATMVENLVGIVKNDNDAIGVTKLIELTTKIWKASTLFHPSWTINDTIGNLIFMLNMGISPAEIAKHAKDAFKVAYHNNFAADKLKDLNITLRGSPAKGIDAIHAAVQKKGAPAEAVMDVIGLGMYDVSGRIKLKGRFKEGVKELYTERARQAIYRSQAQTINQLPWSKKLQAGAKVALHDGIRDRVWAPWLSMNGVANDWMRTTAYMAMLDRGMDPTSAARAVSEGMLDMGDLTGFEKKIRKFIPFYQWTKNSGIYAMKQLFQNPKFYTLAPHAKRAIEEAIDGEQRIPEHMRPSWMRDAMAIQFGTDPNSRKMLLAQQALPNEAGAYMALLAGSPVLGQEALADALGYFGNALTPLLKAPLEIGQGSEWFSGRTIGPYGDVTAGEHLVGQIRLAKELGVGTGVRSGGLETAYKTGGVPAVAARALIGGRIQPGDERRLTTGLQRTAQEKETGLRRRIALAEREGDKDASLKARVSLLKHYQQMQQKGLKIPKWAESQVQEVSR